MQFRELEGPSAGWREQHLDGGVPDQDRQRRPVRERPVEGGSGDLYEHDVGLENPALLSLCVTSNLVRDLTSYRTKPPGRRRRAEDGGRKSDDRTEA